MSNEYNDIELAKKEYLILWKYLAIVGPCGNITVKYTAIKKLHADGLLTRISYDTGCPLCEYSYSEDEDVIDCRACPWPSDSGHNYRCLDMGYKDWLYSKTKAERRHTASKIYQLLKKAFAQMD